MRGYGNINICTPELVFIWKIWDYYFVMLDAEGKLYHLYMLSILAVLQPYVISELHPPVWSISSICIHMIVYFVCYKGKSGPY